MAQEKKAAASGAAAIKKAIIFTSENVKYELKGNSYCFKGQKFTADEAVKNEALMVALIASGSPSVVKV